MVELYSCPIPFCHQIIEVPLKTLNSEERRLLATVFDVTIIKGDRGDVDYDSANEDMILHLIPSTEEKNLFPFLNGIDEIWIAIDAGGD